MTNEEVIRHEAREVVHDVSGYTFRGGMEPFMAEVARSLQRFYTPSNKAIFLDEVRNQVDSGIKRHRLTCTKGPDCPTEHSMERALFFIQQELDELPKVVHVNHTSNPKRDTVFISYSHADKQWLDVLKRHFGPFKNRIEFWDDGHLQPGQKWEAEIKSAIARAKVTLLLLSADFFNSEFITKKEIPPLLEAANRDGATILFLVLKPFASEAYPQIMEYQGLNAPSRPFIRMDEADREDLCVNMVRQILTILA